MTESGFGDWGIDLAPLALLAIGEQLTRLITSVDAGGLSPNAWERLERLSSAWEQAKRGVVSARPLVTEPEPGAVSNPTRRSRTPLTPEEVDAIRTARTNGESVLSIAKRFGVHRVTVWEQTKNP